MIPTKASERESFTLTKVEIEGIPNAHILESDSIDSLLVVPGRHLLGYRRQLAAFTATVTWIDALNAAKELPENLNELCTVTVMAEGCGHKPSDSGRMRSRWRSLSRRQLDWCQSFCITE